MSCFQLCSCGVCVSRSCCSIRMPKMDCAQCQWFIIVVVYCHSNNDGSIQFPPYQNDRKIVTNTNIEVIWSPFSIEKCHHFGSSHFLFESNVEELSIPDLMNMMRMHLILMLQLYTLNTEWNLFCCCRNGIMLSFESDSHSSFQ